MEITYNATLGQVHINNIQKKKKKGKGKRKKALSIKNADANRDLEMWHNISLFFKSYCKGISLSLYNL